MEARVRRAIIGRSYVHFNKIVRLQPKPAGFLESLSSVWREEYALMKLRTVFDAVSHIYEILYLRRSEYIIVRYEDRLALAAKLFS